MFNRKGQATTELAIFGSLILVCFAVLVNYAQNLNEQQTLQMQAFRNALKQAYDDNGFVSYGMLKNYRTANVLGGYGEGSRGSASASASVLWAMGDVEGFSYYQVNDDVIELPEEQSVSDIVTSSSKTYSLTENRIEALDGTLTTSKQASVSDTITNRLIFGGGSEIVITQGLGQDGRYSQAAAGGTRTRSMTWITPKP